MTMVFQALHSVPAHLNDMTLVQPPLNKCHYVCMTQLARLDPFGATSLKSVWHSALLSMSMSMNESSSAL